MKIGVEWKAEGKLLLALITAFILFFLLLMPFMFTVSALPLAQRNTEFNNTDGDEYIPLLDNFTIPLEESPLIILNNETLPACLGKNISAMIRNITEVHRENLMMIRLRRRLMLNQTWHERFSILNRTRCEMRLMIEERNREMERLREMLKQGNITREEYVMEMNRIRLEIRTRLRLLQETSKEALKELQKNISEENKKLAMQIVEENQRFQQEMKQLQQRIREEVKERVREQLENKGSGKKK